MRAPDSSGFPALIARPGIDERIAVRFRARLRSFWLGSAPRGLPEGIPRAGRRAGCARKADEADALHRPGVPRNRDAATTLRSRRGGRARDREALGRRALGRCAGGMPMSEHQTYELLALDRPLTAKQMSELRAISTRAEISPTRFWNEYHWGDLKADPAQLVARYFDAGLHVASWGTRRLMLCIPKERIGTRSLEPYFAGRR